MHKKEFEVNDNAASNNAGNLFSGSVFELWNGINGLNQRPHHESTKELGLNQLEIVMFNAEASNDKNSPPEGSKQNLLTKPVRSGSDAMQHNDGPPRSSSFAELSAVEPKPVQAAQGAGGENEPTATKVRGPLQGAVPERPHVPLMPYDGELYASWSSVDMSKLPPLRPKLKGKIPYMPKADEPQQRLDKGEKEK